MSDRPLTLLEIGILAPLGVARVCVDTVLPTLRSELRDLSRQAPAARFIGAMATQQVRTRVERAMAGDCADPLTSLRSFVMTKCPQGAQAGEGVAGRDHSDAATTAVEDPPSGDLPADTKVTGTPPEPTAIPGYRDLSAPQVIALLADLRPEDLAEVERFESAHRRRRTILNRIATLRGQ